jgi:hypothetical protein
MRIRVLFEGRAVPRRASLVVFALTGHSRRRGEGLERELAPNGLLDEEVHRLLRTARDLVSTRMRADCCVPPASRHLVRSTCCAPPAIRCVPRAAYTTLPAPRCLRLTLLLQTPVLNPCGVLRAAWISVAVCLLVEEALEGSDRGRRVRDDLRCPGRARQKPARARSRW